MPLLPHSIQIPPSTWRVKENRLLNIALYVSLFNRLAHVRTAYWRDTLVHRLSSHQPAKPYTTRILSHILAWIKWIGFCVASEPLRLDRDNGTCSTWTHGQYGKGEGERALDMQSNIVVVQHEKWTNKNEREETESKRSRIRHFVCMLRTRVCVCVPNAVSFVRPPSPGVWHVCSIRLASISTFMPVRWAHQLYALCARSTKR